MGRAQTGAHGEEVGAEPVAVAVALARSRGDLRATVSPVRDYVLVSQSKARIEHYRRAEGGAWQYRVAEGEERITLSNGVVLEVDTVFAGVFELEGE